MLFEHPPLAKKMPRSVCARNGATVELPSVAVGGCKASVGRIHPRRINDLQPRAGNPLVTPFSCLADRMAADPVTAMTCLRLISLSRTRFAAWGTRKRSLDEGRRQRSRDGPGEMRGTWALLRLVKTPQADLFINVRPGWERWGVLLAPICGSRLTREELEADLACDPVTRREEAMSATSKAPRGGGSDVNLSRKRAFGEITRAFTLDERMKAGRALRDSAPRTAHGHGKERDLRGSPSTSYSPLMQTGLGISFLYDMRACFSRPSRSIGDRLELWQQTSARRLTAESTFKRAVTAT